MVYISNIIYSIACVYGLITIIYVVYIYTLYTPPLTIYIGKQ